MSQPEEPSSRQISGLIQGLAASLGKTEVRTQTEARLRSDNIVRTIDKLSSTNMGAPSYIADLPDIRHPIPAGAAAPTLCMVTRLASMNVLRAEIDRHVSRDPSKQQSRKVDSKMPPRARAGAQSAQLTHNQKTFSGCSGNGKSYLMLQVAAHIIRQYNNARVVFVRNCNEWASCRGFLVDGQPAADWRAKIAYLVQAMFVGFYGDEGFSEIFQNIDEVSTTNVRTFAAKLANGLFNFCIARKADVSRNGKTASLPLCPFFFFDNIDAVFGPAEISNRDIQIIIHELKSQGFFIIGAPQNNAYMEQMSGSNPLFVPTFIPRVLKQEEAYEYLRQRYDLDHLDDDDMERIQAVKRHTDFFPAEIDVFLETLDNSLDGRAISRWAAPGPNELDAITQPNAGSPVFDTNYLNYRCAVFQVYHAIHVTDVPVIKGGGIPFANHPHVQPASDSTGYTFSSPRRGYFSFHEVFPRGQDPFSDVATLFSGDENDNGRVAFAGIVFMIRNGARLVGPALRGNIQNAPDPNFERILPQRLESKAPQTHDEILDARDSWAGDARVLAFYDTSLKASGVNAMRGLDFVLYTVGDPAVKIGFFITAMVPSTIELQDIIIHCTGALINWDELHARDVNDYKFAPRDRIALGIAEAAETYYRLYNGNSVCNVYLVTSHEAAQIDQGYRARMLPLTLRNSDVTVSVQLRVIDIRALDGGRTRFDFRRSAAAGLSAAQEAVPAAD